MKKSEKILELDKLLKSGKAQRRHIRYKLFQIKFKNDDVDVDLKEYIESQFTGENNWSNFTFGWDVGVDDPLKVISVENWVSSGGQFDLMGKRIPPAFTQQK